MKKEARKLEGIGGWLLLLVLILFVQAINYLFYIFILLRENTISIIIQSLLLLFTIIALYLIFNKNKKAPKFAIFLLWISVLYNAFIYLIPKINDLITETLFSFFNLGLELAPSYLSNMLSFIFSLLITILWTLYLLTSRRVENTFGVKPSKKMGKFRENLLSFYSKTSLFRLIIFILLLIILVPFLLILFFGSLVTILMGLSSFEGEFILSTFIAGLFGISISIGAFILLVKMIIKRIKKRE